MVRIPFLVSSAVLAASLTGCAGHLAATHAEAVSASPSSEVPLTGHWRGSVWESNNPPIVKQGAANIDIAIAPDGTWQGTIGTGQASGIVRQHGSRVVLIGSVRDASGHAERVYFDLAGNNARRWSETPFTFSGRESPATVSLHKVA